MASINNPFIVIEIIPCGTVRKKLWPNFFYKNLKSQREEKCDGVSPKGRIEYM